MLANSGNAKNAYLAAVVMYLFTKLQKIAFLPRMSAGKIGHLILRGRQQHDISVMATACQRCEERCITSLGKILSSGQLGFGGSSAAGPDGSGEHPQLAPSLQGLQAPSKYPPQSVHEHGTNALCHLVLPLQPWHVAGCSWCWALRVWGLRLSGEFKCKLSSYPS